MNINNKLDNNNNSSLTTNSKNAKYNNFLQIYENGSVTNKNVNSKEK